MHGTYGFYFLIYPCIAKNGSKIYKHSYVYVQIQSASPTVKMFILKFPLYNNLAT